MPAETIRAGDITINEIFLQEMGIKEVYVGGEPVYQRKGGYFYLTLDTKETD